MTFKFELPVHSINAQYKESQLWSTIKFILSDIAERIKFDIFIILPKNLSFFLELYIILFYKP